MLKFFILCLFSEIAYRVFILIDLTTVCLSPLSFHLSSVQQVKSVEVGNIIHLQERMEKYSAKHFLPLEFFASRKVEKLLYYKKGL